MQSELSHANQHGQFDDVDEFCAAWSKAFQTAGQQTLSAHSEMKKKPWISDRTLRYIADRAEAKKQKDSAMQFKMNKLIKHSVKQDRADWFRDMLDEGNWQAVQQFRKVKPAIS